MSPLLKNIAIVKMIDAEIIKRLEALAISKDTDINTLLEDYLTGYENNDSIMDITLDAVISTNAFYQIIAFNKGAENLFGYKKEAVIGQPLEILIPAEYHHNHRQHMQQFAKSNDATRLMNERNTIYCQRKDGTEFPTQATISKSGAGQDILYHVVLRDISEEIETRQQLEKSEDTLQLVMDNITDLVCLHELDGVFSFVSMSSIHLVGYQPDELTGKSPYDYIHPDDVNLVRNLNELMVAGEAVNSVLYRFLHKDGHYIWCETKAHLAKDHNDIVTHIVTGTRNVTEQMRVHQALQQERDLLAKIMKTSPCGIVVLDKSGKIEFANDRAGEILHVDKAEQLRLYYNSAEWKHTHLDGSPWSDEEQPFTRVMTTGEPVYNVQHAIESSDGQRVLLSINGAPIFNDKGDISKVVFSIVDITELKRAEVALSESLTKAREVNILKSRFLSIVSHEFRTPLSVILTSTDLLEHLAKDKLNPKEVSRLEQIRTQVKYLDIQLDEISTLNKSNQISQVLNLEHTYVIELLTQLISETQVQYQDCPDINLITAHTKTDSFLLDPQLIQHIFTNLISNAVKYSNGQGEITITLTCTNNILYFSIKDQGIGIQQDDQDKLFDFFFRGDNVGGVKGTGIGLAVVKQSVHAHKGQIEFTSQVGVGSTFTVTIPIPNNT